MFEREEVNDLAGLKIFKHKWRLKYVNATMYSVNIMVTFQFIIVFNNYFVSAVMNGKQMTMMYNFTLNIIWANLNN